VNREKMCTEKLEAGREGEKEGYGKVTLHVKGGK
jgi:hypothetical protein